MYSRDAHPAYSSVANARSLTFQFSLIGANNPLLNYGSNWIASVVQSTSNTYTVTMKDGVFAVIDCSTNLRDDSKNGSYATIGSFTNEQTNNGVTFVLSTFVAGGGALANPGSVGTPVKISGTLTINNGNVTTPGGN